MATDKIPESKATNAYELLDEVRALILEEPLRYDQSTWIERENQSGEADKGFPACGTVGCVAGWVATLKASQSFGYWDTETVAARILGLDLEQARALFDSDAVHGNAQTREYAEAGAEHISDFQEDYRVQLLAKKV